MLAFSSNRNNLVVSATAALLLLCFLPILASALSDQCMMESQVLQNNSAILETIPTGGACIIRATERETTDSSCTFDYAPMSAAFQNACVDHGGRFYSESQHYDCRVIGGSGRLRSADLYYLNNPFCFGKNCSIPEIQEYFRKVIYDDLEQRYVSEYGLDCQVSRAADRNGAQSYESKAFLLTLGLGLLLFCVVGAIYVACASCCRAIAKHRPPSKDLPLVLPSGTLQAAVKPARTELATYKQTDLSTTKLPAETTAIPTETGLTDGVPPKDDNIVRDDVVVAETDTDEDSTTEDDQEEEQERQENQETTEATTIQTTNVSTISTIDSEEKVQTLPMLPYENLVEFAFQHTQMLMSMHEGLRHLSKSKSYHVDLATGTITFLFDDTIVTALAQLLGTWYNGSFLWGWDHPSAIPGTAIAATAVKTYADRHAIAELQDPKPKTSFEDSWKLVSVAVLIGNLQGLFRFEAGPGNWAYIGLGPICLQNRDFSTIDSKEKAQNLLQKGELVMLDLSFGRLDDPFANPMTFVFVPPFAAFAIQKRINEDVSNPGVEGRAHLELEYKGNSLIPSALVLFLPCAGGETEKLVVEIW